MAEGPQDGPEKGLGVEGVEGGLRRRLDAAGPGGGGEVLQEEAEGIAGILEGIESHSGGRPKNQSVKLEPVPPPRE
jgi:hypothetical protein